MALLSDSLSVWEIGFRWAGYDPARWWWRIPLPVRDNFRVLMDAVLNAQLRAENIFMEKRDPSDPHAFPPEFYIRSHLDDIEACMEGRRFDRRLLHFARIERAAFQDWCARRTIALPEFWFPTGWSLSYQYPEGDEKPESERAGYPRLLRLAHRLPLRLRRESPSLHLTPPISSSHLSKVSGISGETQYCFTYRGEPIRWKLTNSAWHTALRKAGIEDFRFHDLRHTWASWHRRAGPSTDELKDLGGWKSRVMVDRYAKFATEHLAVAAARIDAVAW